jgi:hypothetical protein
MIWSLLATSLLITNLFYSTPISANNPATEFVGHLINHSGIVSIVAKKIDAARVRVVLEFGTVVDFGVIPGSFWSF